jgi:hypothetical protein
METGKVSTSESNDLENILRSILCMNLKIISGSGFFFPYFTSLELSFHALQLLRVLKLLIGSTRISIWWSLRG